VNGESHKYHNYAYFLKAPRYPSASIPSIHLMFYRSERKSLLKKKLPLLAESFILQRISDGRITGLQLVEILLMLCFQ
jgi:hypothetical protein